MTNHPPNTNNTQRLSASHLSLQLANQTGEGRQPSNTLPAKGLVRMCPKAAKCTRLWCKLST